MDYLHITLEAGPYISWPKLRDAIALARQPDHSTLAGADAVAGLIRRAASSDDEFPVRQALATAHKDALTQALPDLPPFYAGMKPEEVEAFQEAHRNHPALRTFDVPYPYSKHDLEKEAHVRENLKRRYEAIFNQALLEGRITGVNRDPSGALIHLEGHARSITPWTQLERASVLGLLSSLAFIVTGTGDDVPPDQPQSKLVEPSTESQHQTKQEQRLTLEAETRQGSSKGLRSSERIRLITQALEQTSPDKQHDVKEIYATLVRIIEDDDANSARKNINCFRLEVKGNKKVIIHTGITDTGVSNKENTEFQLVHLSRTLQTIRGRINTLSEGIQT